MGEQDVGCRHGAEKSAAQRSFRALHKPQAFPSIRSVRAWSGFRLVILATAIAGAAAYLVTWVVPRLIGGEEYKVFAVFWASMYLVVTALSGIQQEITRGTRPAVMGERGHDGTSRVFGLVSAAIAFVAVVLTAPFWVDRVFPELGWSLVFPLAVGVASYVLVATVSGVLYGIAQWRPLAYLVASEALLRVAVVSIVAIFTPDLVALAWAASLPFLATLLLLWPYIGKSVVRASLFDVGYRELAWNVSRTLLASTATGLLVSGLPLLLSLSSPNEPPQLLASLFLTITLTRAPLIVTLMSIQGFLIVRFRDQHQSVGRDLRRYVAGIMGAGSLLAAAGWSAGPTIFGWLFPGEPVLEGWFFAVLVLSSALVGALCVTAPAVLARGLHSVYSLGWVSSAIATVIVLILPLDLLARTCIALLVGPTVGILIHLTVLARPATPPTRLASPASA